MANPFFIFLLIFAIPCSAIGVWPQPRTMSWPVPSATSLSPSFTISSPYHRCLSPGVNRYLQLIKTEGYNPLVAPSVNLTNGGPSLQTLILSIKDLSAPISHGANESYSLSIPISNDRATLIAKTAWGAMRGLETFSKLVEGKPSRVVVGIKVSDWPICDYRGIMLDTSRNYYEVEDILRMIRAMSTNKLNVFHWHITYAQSFPVVLPSEPDLAAKGSYGSGMHSYGILGRWLPGDCSLCKHVLVAGWFSSASGRARNWPSTSTQSKDQPSVKNVIDDITKMFPDLFYHSGADEINPGCWKTDPSIQAYLAKNGTLSQLLEMFVNSTLPYILSHNRTVVYLEDILLDANVKADASFYQPEHVIIQTWSNGPNNTKKLVSSGYRTIGSSSDYCYLDCGHGDFFGNDSHYDQPPYADQGKGGSSCGPFKKWQIIYNYNIAYNLTDEVEKSRCGRSRQIHMFWILGFVPEPPH